MPMAEGDDPMEGYDTSPVLGSVESKQSGDVLSPEDVAWADSCLIKDPEISHSDWNSLTDALLETLSSLPDSVDFSGVVRDSFPAETDTEILPMNEEAESSQNLERSVADIVPINEEDESNNDHIIHDKTDALSERTNMVNGFLLRHNEGLKKIENTDDGVELGSHVSEMEPSTDDIFRVWDLDIPDEEDEFIKELNKALAESSLQPTPSTIDDSGVSKDLKEESLDDLISGIAELSLKISD